MLPIHPEPGVWCARAATKKVSVWKPIPRNPAKNRKYRTRSGKNTAILKSISIKRKERILPKKLKPNKQKGFGGVLHFHYSFWILGVSLCQRLRAGLVRFRWKAHKKFRGNCRRIPGAEIRFNPLPVPQTGGFRQRRGKAALRQTEGFIGSE